MVGYMKPQTKELKSEHKKIYQALYCGLCRNLKYDYGLRGSLLINYEIVDILLVIESLLPDEPLMTNRSCSITPFLWRKMIGCDDALFRLGAAIAVIIAALELNDNVVDDGKTRDKVLYSLLKSAIEKVKKAFPDVWNSIETLYNEYMLQEQEVRNNNVGFYSVLACCGAITRKVGEILGASVSDEYAYIMGIFMHYWGEWIYLLDAVDDYEKDCREGKYNPLKLSDCPENIAEVLQELEENAMDVIAKLQMKRYQPLITELFGTQFPDKRRLICRTSKYCSKEW